jgi:small subunit ribosomal protein S1
LDQDPFSLFVAANEKGSIVKGTVTEVTAKMVKIDLAENIEGILRASEISRDRVEDASTVINVGDEIEAKFMGVDRKTRAINLSIKAKDYADEAQVMKEYSGGAASSGTLGDIFKEQLDK